MKLLLDTHLLIWAAEGIEHLPAGARGLMEAPPIGDVTEDYFAQPGNGFRMGRPPIMIEVLTRIDGVAFPAARARAVMEDVNEAGLRVPIIPPPILSQTKLPPGDCKTSLTSRPCAKGWKLYAHSKKRRMHRPRRRTTKRSSVNH